MRALKARWRPACRAAGAITRCGPTRCWATARCAARTGWRSASTRASRRAPDRAGAASATTRSSSRELVAAVPGSGHRAADAAAAAGRAAGAAATTRSPAACAIWPSCASTSSRTIEREVGVIASEQVLIAFAQHAARALHRPRRSPATSAARALLLLLERGNERDIKAWCEKLVERVVQPLVPRWATNTLPCHLHDRPVRRCRPARSPS